MRKKYSYKNSKTGLLYILSLLILIIIILNIFIYFYLVYYLLHVDKLQSKEWITDLTNKIILGTKDKKYLDILRSESSNNVNFWYTYYFIHTKKYTIWILFNLKNKFSDRLVINVFYYDFTTNKVKNIQILNKFSELEVFKKDEVLIIKTKNYLQTIDFKNNLMTQIIKSGSINIELKLNITNYATNQGSFIPRYNSIRKLIKVDGIETMTPGEWMSDNGFTGKIIGCTINNETFNDGNFWFDNYIGTNNHFLSPYIWFVVLNDDWLIYLLWFGEYDKRNDPNTKRPVLIKDIKNDKVLYSGIETYNYLKPITNMYDPVKMYYNSNSTIGAETYDDYEVVFESSVISIKFSPIKGESHRALIYDYYNTDDDMDKDNLNSWDKDYYNVIKNLKYTEYVNNIKVNIKYNNKEENFVARQVIDSMFRINKNIPNSIKFSN